MDPTSSSSQPQLQDLYRHEQDLLRQLELIEQQRQTCQQSLQRVRTQIQQATTQVSALTASSSGAAAAAVGSSSSQHDQFLSQYFAPDEQEQQQDGSLNPLPPPLRASSSSAAVPPTAAVKEQQQQLALDQRIQQLLQGTFEITTGFREHQQAIVHATLRGQDVFVIMRTGGGKSLTYQLPALLEGRPAHGDGKITLVVSPLLSLIQDQEEQMNRFCLGSAVSFSSAKGTSHAEQSQVWKQVQDPAQGICLVLVTPERVSSSNRLKNELQKLYNNHRLGRIVIDECHCASTWGHDFRPDYKKLGVLKRQFPDVPVLAVTATASNVVRDDVVRILEMNPHSYRFFRSTANRQNLHYSVRNKAESSSSGKDGVIVDMAAFIKEKHAHHPGIIYTFSKKDADTVAGKLCDCGIFAKAYHSEVSAKKKEQIHKSWMRNETQVVVATIAFGLGINKPDVRFVLHHTISKTLDSYYQESGRAGRDGKDADCVLYYSPKDVPRMVRMVHDTGGTKKLLNMAKYAQAHGNDAVCRAIILQHLGEPNAPNLDDVIRQNDGVTTEPRDVGRHAQTVVRLLEYKEQTGEDVTLPMLVKEWRSKPENAPPCVQEFPPGKELTVDECERILISLWNERVIVENVQWNAYDAVVYFCLTDDIGHKLAASANPKFIMRFPKKETKEAKAAKQKQAKKATAGLDGWFETKPKATKRKKSSATSKAKGKKTKTASAPKGKASKKPKAKKSTPTTRKHAAAKTLHQTEVIELSSDDDDDTTVEEFVPPSTKSRMSPEQVEEALWKSDSEYEFED